MFFAEEGFIPEADFQQVIIFTKINKSETPGKYLVEAKIVTYKTIEDAEFIITDAGLAKMFQKILLLTQH